MITQRSSDRLMMLPGLGIQAISALANGSDPYVAVINSLAATVIAYWPLDESSGTTVNDRSGNGRGGASSGVTLAQAGQLGNAYQFAAAGTLTAGAALTAAIDPREYAVSMIINVNRNDANVPRLHVIYTDTLANYSVPEVRTGNRLDMYLQEDGSTQNKQEFGILPDEQWLHLVFFNSESQGQFGAYINRLYLPAGRQLAGLPVGEDTVTAAYPQLGALLTGYLQHIVWLDVGIPSQADVDLLYYGAFAQPSTEIVYQMTDTFSDTDDAPLTSPRASGLVVTDTGNLMSTNGASLIWTGKTTDVAVPRVLTPAVYARLQGRASVGLLTPGSIAAGWRATNTGSPNGEAFLFQSSTLFSYSNAVLLTLGSATTNGTVEYKTAHVMRRYGGLHFIKGGAFTEWTLIWTSGISLADWYGGFGVGSASAANAINAVKVADLPAPFNQDFDIATTRLAGGRAAGNTFTHPADCIIEFTLTTRPSAGSIDFRFRVQDASNYWQLLVGTTGNTTLNEVVAGTPTTRGTGTPGMNTGGRAIIVCVGNTLRGLAQVGSSYAFMWTAYTSATNFATETDGELTGLGTGGRVSDIVVWPRTLSGAAVTVLDEAVA